MKRVRLTGGMSVVFLFRSELAVGRCSLDERLMSLGVISSARSKPRAICVNGREALDCKTRQQTSRAGFRVWLANHAGLSAHMTVVTQAGCESFLFVYYFLKSSRTWKGLEKTTERNWDTSRVNLWLRKMFILGTTGLTILFNQQILFSRLATGEEEPTWVSRRNENCRSFR